MIRIICLIITSIICFDLKSQNATIKNYKEKSLTVKRIYVNDTLNFTLGQGTVDGFFFKIHARTDLEMVELASVAETKGIDIGKLNKKYISIQVGNSYYNIEHEDYKLLLPSYISSFSFLNKKYFIINFHLISFMSGNYWFNLVFTQGKDGKLKQSQRFETNGNLKQNQLGDRNKDGKLDYWAKVGNKKVIYTMDE